MTGMTIFGACVKQVPHIVCNVSIGKLVCLENCFAQLIPTLALQFAGKAVCKFSSLNYISSEYGRLSSLPLVFEGH